MPNADKAGNAGHGQGVVTGWPEKAPGKSSFHKEGPSQSL